MVDENFEDKKLNLESKFNAQQADTTKKKCIIHLLDITALLPKSYRKSL